MAITLEQFAREQNLDIVYTESSVKYTTISNGYSEPRVEIYDGCICRLVVPIRKWEIRILKEGRWKFMERLGTNRTRTIESARDHLLNHIRGSRLCIDQYSQGTREIEVPPNLE